MAPSNNHDRYDQLYEQITGGRETSTETPVYGQPRDFSKELFGDNNQTTGKGRDFSIELFGPRRRSYGEEFRRQAQLTARHGLEGVGGVLDLVASPIRVAANYVLPDNMKIRGNTGAHLADAIGLPAPETASERVAGDVTRAMASGGAFIKGAQVASRVGTEIANAVAKQLANAPASQIVSAAMGGGASGSARESGASEAGQLFAGLAGATAPATVGVGINTAKRAKEHIYPSVGDIARRAAGDKADDVIHALETTKSSVPGVRLTVGDASVPANSAEFAAFYKAAIDENPSKYYGPKGVEGQQSAARLDAVRSFGKTKKDLSDALDARTVASDKNYTAAYAQRIKSDPDLDKLMENPYIQDVLPEAMKLMQANNLSTKADLTQYLHYVKLGLDAKLQAANNPNLPAMTTATKKAIEDAKLKLVGWLEKKNPLYDKARLYHMEASKPINQMRVGQELERALINPATGTERATVFGNKVRQAENTISKGSGNYLIQDLTPEQREIVNAIQADLLRKSQYQNLAKVGTKSMEERIGAATVMPTGIFEPIISAARSWVNERLKTGHQQAMHRAAEVMDNPLEMARLMREATPKQRKVLEKLWAQRMIQGLLANKEDNAVIASENQ